MGKETVRKVEGSAKIGSSPTNLQTTSPPLYKIPDFHLLPKMDTEEHIKCWTSAIAGHETVGIGKGQLCGPKGEKGINSCSSESLAHALHLSHTEQDIPLPKSLASFSNTDDESGISTEQFREQWLLAAPAERYRPYKAKEISEGENLQREMETGSEQACSCLGKREQERMTLQLPPKKRWTVNTLVEDTSTNTSTQCCKVQSSTPGTEPERLRAWMAAVPDCLLLRNEMGDSSTFASLPERLLWDLNNCAVASVVQRLSRGHNNSTVAPEVQRLSWNLNNSPSSPESERHSWDQNKTLGFEPEVMSGADYQILPVQGTPTALTAQSHLPECSAGVSMWRPSHVFHVKTCSDKEALSEEEVPARGNNMVRAKHKQPNKEGERHTALQRTRHPFQCLLSVPRVTCQASADASLNVPPPHGSWLPFEGEPAEGERMPNSVLSYHCKVCGKAFTKFQSLGGHMSTHRQVSGGIILHCAQARTSDSTCGSDCAPRQGLWQLPVAGQPVTTAPPAAILVMPLPRAMLCTRLPG